MSRAEEQVWTCPQCDQMNAPWVTSCACTTTEVKEQTAFPKGLFAGRPRPNRHDPAIIARAVNKLLPDVFDWLEASDVEKNEVAHQLLSVVDGFSDGYAMAKELESRYSWDGDSELVEILDNLDLYGSEREAVLAWIKENNIAPKFTIGTEVTVKVSRSEETHNGIIRNIGEDGTYVVNIPELGHVQDGLGTHGVVLPWESVEELNSLGATDGQESA